MAKDTKNNKDIKKNKHFFKDFKAELKKVIWPTPKQLANKTIAVVVIVLITAAIVFVLDVIFDLLNEQGINRLKSNIRNKVVVENTAYNTENSDENVIDANSTESEPSDENVTDVNSTEESSEENAE